LPDTLFQTEFLVLLERERRASAAARAKPPRTITWKYLTARRREYDLLRGRAATHPEGVCVCGADDLVQAFGALHGWPLSGDRVADKDRYWRDVRRALNVLAGSGVIGIDVSYPTPLGSGGRRRLSIRPLLPAAVSDAECAAADQQLAVWARRRRPPLPRGARRRVLSDDDVSSAQSLRDSGESVTAIAAKLGVTRDTIYKWTEAPTGLRGPHRRLALAERAELRSLVAAGATVKAAAEQVGCSTTTANRHAPRGGTRRSSTAQQRDQARRLRAEGFATADIAAVLGFSTGTIWRWAPISRSAAATLSWAASTGRTSRRQDARAAMLTRREEARRLTAAKREEAKRLAAAEREDAKRQDREEAERLMAAGVGTAEIAGRLGYERSTIDRWARAGAWHASARRRPPGTPQQREEARRLRAEGLSTDEIAARVGYNAKTISRWAPVGRGTASPAVKGRDGRGQLSRLPGAGPR
jgi:IS30 family transposase